MFGPRPTARCFAATSMVFVGASCTTGNPAGLADAPPVSAAPELAPGGSGDAPHQSTGSVADCEDGKSFDGGPALLCGSRTVALRPRPKGPTEMAFVRAMLDVVDVTYSGTKVQWSAELAPDELKAKHGEARVYDFIDRRTGAPSFPVLFLVGDEAYGYCLPTSLGERVDRAEEIEACQGLLESAFATH